MYLYVRLPGLDRDSSACINWLFPINIVLQLNIRYKGFCHLLIIRTIIFSLYFNVLFLFIFFYSDFLSVYFINYLNCFWLWMHFRFRIWWVKILTWRKSLRLDTHTWYTYLFSSWFYRLHAEREFPLVPLIRCESISVLASCHSI